MAEKGKAAAREEQIFDYWQKERVFEKTLQKDAPKGDYVFYDGPPFATGLPHYGHIVASVIKDVVPRYFTMQGYRVPRRWGWDCHGLPIENLVEKELGTKRKKDIIENVGIEKFNELCREKVLLYADEWKKVIPRIGRWADMDNPYFTMSRDYMESVWWVFKQVYDKGLVYEDYRSMHVCPRCETTLSQGEVAEGYKDIKDLSVTAKFELVDEPGTYLLAWTTTPWTLPGNVALAVNPEMKYERWRGADGVYLVAETRAANVVPADGAYVLEEGKTVRGKDLVGKAYKPLFDSYANNSGLKNRENGWKVYAADFVTTDTGTGIVHIAPAFGADDMALGKKENLPFVQHLGMDGIIKPEVKELAGLSVKPIDNHQATDVEVLKYLQAHGLLFSKENYTHSYSHCWRCDTPLINYATSSWFVKVEDIKPTLLKTAEDINWSPAHIKEGRFGKWLEGARDWSISRQRFWASVMPLWRCDSCSEVVVCGSAAELEEKSGRKVDDLHKHIVDAVMFPCACCGTMRRVPDVLDTWFDSGSMPYGQAHYPFEHKDSFEKAYPAQFIAEGQDQTRAWFYYLHVLAGALFEKKAFQNVIVNGIVLAEDGKKMAKKLQNYPDPMLVVDKYGADALRLYLMGSPVVSAENLNFSEEGVHEMQKKVVDRLVNVYEFYALYKDSVAHEATPGAHALDQWVAALVHGTHHEVTDAMESYQLDRAVRALVQFNDDLSTWYVRRSRDRIKGADADAAAALGTLAWVLQEYAKLLAPFAPFIAEWLWQELGHTESVHMESWGNGVVADRELLHAMDIARQVVTQALEARTKAGLKVRQPLASLTIPHALSDDIRSIIADEVNVKHVVVGQEMKLDTVLTQELLEEGSVRELIRAVQDLRKKKNLSPQDKVVLLVSGSGNAIVETYRDRIMRVAGISDIQFGELGEGEHGTWLVEGGTVAELELQ